MEKWSITRRDLGRVIKVAESGYEAINEVKNHFNKTHSNMNIEYKVLERYEDNSASITFDWSLNPNLSKETQEVYNIINYNPKVSWKADYVIEKAV